MTTNIKFQCKVETNKKIVEAFSKFLEENKDSIKTARLSEMNQGYYEFRFTSKVFDLQIIDSKEGEEEENE